MSTIIVCCGHDFIIDEDDKVLFLSHNWKITKNKVGQIYMICGKLRFHREILKCPKGCVVDHINGNFFDNRKSNLRICSLVQNVYNQKKHNLKRTPHSKYKGVTFRKDLKSKPWEAFIYKDKKSKRLGYFKTEREAALAYNKAAIEAYGEYAKINLT